MKITSSEFILSAVKKEHYPNEQFPEFLLAGRSNVGKSSFINKMLNKKGIAHTSSRPGKTQTLNFFLINENFYFVDVPGYGYAKVSKKMREEFGQMIEEYITNRENLKCMVLLVDFRHKPSEDDVLMYNFLKYYDIDTIVVATKLDKVNRSQYKKNENLIRQTLNMTESAPLIKFSSETGEGKEAVWSLLAQYLN